MSDATKITLSQSELEKVQDTDWILTKQLIIGKAGLLMNAQVDVITDCFSNLMATFPAPGPFIPKMSKGEHYKLLPYVILDYPATFSKDDIFAVRTMFWWGNFISVTLHLSGKYRALYSNRLKENLQANAGTFFLCINESQWEHDFTPDNYTRVSNINKNELHKIFAVHPFIKIAINYELANWNSILPQLKAAYEAFAMLLKD